MNPSLEPLWRERLRLLREFYAVGLQILTEAPDVRDTRISPYWKELDDLWDQFLAMEQQLRNHPLPKDDQLRTDLLTQARANAALFRSLEQHCRAIQQQIADLLPSLPRYQHAQSATTPATRLQDKV